MTATLAEPKPIPTPSYEDGEFIDFGYVPVFKEHCDREGNEFDSQALERIVQRCNERIEDTGDFSPLVIGHTDDGGKIDPEVVGFVGPYRLGKVGSKNPRTAILGRLRVFKRDADRVRRYPRLSVELWSSKSDPTNGYFDPVSLLGATTPELDLGIRFSKHGEGEVLRRYSRVTRFEATPTVPGGSNTYIPGGLGDEKKKTTYESSGGMLSDADIQQIIAALKPVVEEAVDARMAAMKSADPMAGGMAGGMGDAMGDMGGDAGAEEMGGLAGGDAEQFSAEGETGDLGDADDEGDEFASDDADFESMKDGESGPGDEDGEDDDADDDDADEPNEDDTEVVDSLPDDGDSPPDKKKKYAADANAGRSVPLSNDEDLVMADNPNPAADAAEQVKRFQKERDDAKAELVKVTKERDELKTKYQKEVEARRGSETELTSIKDRLAKIEASERRAVRYQKLSEIAARGYTFDPAEEIEDVKDLSQDAFDKHCERIVKQYQRVPTDMLPVAASDRLDHARRVKGDGEAERRERFSKIAQDNCLRSGKHKPGEFKAELERLLAEDDAKNGGKSAA